MRKLVRLRDRAVQDSANRLQEFLAALQASPNGVLLLDHEGRIEWLNQTAAEHFGLDARRDMLQHLGNLVRDPAFAEQFFGIWLAAQTSEPQLRRALLAQANLAVPVGTAP